MSNSMPGPREQWLNTFRLERATTLKVMRAFPADKGEFQPHPRSQSAIRLMHTFTIELSLITNAIKGTLKMPPEFPPPPTSVGAAIAAYEQAVKDVDAAVSAASDDKVVSTVPFFTGPGKMGDVPIMGIMSMMLMDSIHHRGQLSVYIRMAGGKVPSIYGPSADEPWD